MDYKLDPKVRPKGKPKKTWSEFVKKTVEIPTKHGRCSKWRN